ncbi:MAG TPA: hypothetical protein VHW45_09920, partial [Candidatus Sulfotelmatobacter sp.]|nr:hypothetical protein [Candidatus Sulfotelmatobacter sp.]
MPSRLWGLTFPAFDRPAPGNDPSTGEVFYLRPRYRSERPLDATLRKVQSGLDQFVSEKYADQLATVIATWSASLLQNAHDTAVIEQHLAPNFSGTSPTPADLRTVRSEAMLQVHRSKFADTPNLNRDAFLRDWQSALDGFSAITIAEFQITGIEIGNADAATIP